MIWLSLILSGFLLFSAMAYGGEYTMLRGIGYIPFPIFLTASYVLSNRFRFAVTNLTPVLTIYHSIFWIGVNIYQTMKIDCDSECEEIEAVDSIFQLMTPSEGDAMLFNMILFATFLGLNFKQVLYVYVPNFIISAVILDVFKQRNISFQLSHSQWKDEELYEFDFTRSLINSLAMRVSMTMFYCTLVKIVYDNEWTMIKRNR